MGLLAATVEFTSKGDVADPAQAEAALGAVRRAGATDVLLLAHGWNNDMARARELFEDLSASLAAERHAPSRSLAVIGLLWPAVRWADEDELAGGGASVAGARAALDAAIADGVDDPELADRLRAAADALEGAGGPPPAAGGAGIDGAAGGTARAGAAAADPRQEFVDTLRRLLPPDAAGDPTDADKDEEPVPQALAAGDAAALFAAVEEAEVGVQDAEDFAAATPVPEGPPGSFPDLLAGSATAAPTTTGAGLGLGGLSPLVLARRLLNLTTYYTMKDRAGRVGSRGVVALIDQLRRDLPDGVRVHLAGHSFGARVVSAAAATTDAPVGAVCLLQGAFSHFGFAANYADTGKDGAFRRALTGGHLRGPVLVTHTHNDRAVRTAYAVASRVARQTGAGLVGGPNDPYGGIGANGAVATDEARDGHLLDGRAQYEFAPGRVHNLRADDFVAGHGSVTGPEVAHAIAAAIAAAGR